MKLDGTYKISIEMTARKQVEGIVGSTERLLGIDPGKRRPGIEEQIQSIIDSFREDQDVFDSFSMTIANDLITIRTSEGEMLYRIMRRLDKDANHIVLELKNEELNDPTWKVTLADGYLFIDSVDAISEYVLKKL